MKQEIKFTHNEQQFLQDSSSAVGPSHFSLLVEKNEVGLFSLENDRITYANPSFIRIIESTPSQVIGHSILQFIDEKDHQLLSNALEVMKNAQSDRFSKEIRLRKSDEVCFISLHLTVVSRSDEHIVIIGASRNATQRVQKRIELSHTKAQYEALYRNLQDGIFIYNYIDEKVIDCNQAALDILGFNEKSEMFEVNRYDLIPKTSKFFPGYDLHEITRVHGVRVIKGESFNSKGVFIGKDNKEILANVNVVPTLNSTGEAYVIFHDTTSSVLNKLALKSSESRYRDLFENSHEAIIYTDFISKKPILCNKNALDLFGFATFEEFAQVKFVTFFADKMIDGVSASSYVNVKMQQALDKGRAELSYRFRKNNGKIIIVESVLIGDNSHKGKPKIISFARDVTIIHNAQKALNDKNEELKKYIDSNLQLENFAYLASHDLQTPLRSIISFTQLLKRRTTGQLSKESIEFMEYIIKSSLNMQKLINDLLSYSRVNTTEIVIEKIAPREMLRDMLIELNPIIKEQKAQINQVDIPLQIHADPTKIRQVFQNLMTNALKFHRADRSVIINIKAEETAHEWLFSIEDNGIGIPEEYQQKIFLLFKRLHGPSEFEGTGIGLAMVKKIIEQHDGKIWIESNKDKGTTFYFTIVKPNLSQH